MKSSSNYLGPNHRNLKVSGQDHRRVDQTEKRPLIGYTVVKKGKESSFPHWIHLAPMQPNLDHT
jgi:hypothetical protein